MIWPFTLIAENAVLRQRVADHEAARAAALEREVYWRTRYERIADAVMFKAGEINSPVHVDPKADNVTSIGSRVMRAAGLAGNSAGIDFKKPHAVTVETVKP